MKTKTKTKPRSKVKANKESVNIFIPITSLGATVKGKFSGLKPNKVYELQIDYPLDKVYVFEIKTGKGGVALIELLAKIGEIYKHIYDNEEKYGIWGHSIDDLCLEGIYINHTTRKIAIDIGS